MKKNITLLLSVLFFVLLVFSPGKVFAVDAEGIWANLNVIYDEYFDYNQCCPDNWSCDGAAGTGYIFRCGTLEAFGIFDNIDFDNLDNIGDFGTKRRNATAPHEYAEFRSTPYIYFPDDGFYRFSVEKSALGTDFSFYIKDPDTDSYTLFKGYKNNGSSSLWSPDLSSKQIYLDAGWYKTRIEAQIWPYVETPKLKFSWRRPGESVYSLIPKENYKWTDHSNKEIVIPSMVDPEEKVNFYTAGVGTDDYIAAGTDPKISLQISNASLSSSNFTDVDGAYVFWFDKDTADLTPSITIQNTSMSGSPEDDVVGERLISPVGEPWKASYAKIPTSLLGFNETTREMSFVFKNRDASNTGYGIGMVIPYKDDTLLSSKRLYLKLNGQSPYRGAYSPVTFDLDDDIDKTNLKPVFFFGDGETSGGVKYRPNYMNYLAGSGPKPGVDSDLRNMGSTRLFPKEGVGNFSFSNPDTWGVSAGREGLMFDVITSLGNYLPNQESSYVNSGGDGIVDAIDADGEEWVSFQAFSSNFSGDGNAGSPESIDLFVIGLLGGEKNSKVAICPDTFSSLIFKGDELNFKAYYWDDYAGTGNYCDETATADEDVTNSVSWSTTDSSVLDTGSGNGVFNAIAQGDAKAVVEYTTPSSVVIKDEVDVHVTEIAECFKTVCDKTTGYECKEVQMIGDACPAGASDSNCTDTVTPETCEIEGWREVTP